MHKVKEEAVKIIQQIQPHISGFSHSLKLNGKDREEVICGGRITQIVDMGNWSDLPEADIVHLTIDDAVGDMLVSVPGKLWRDISARIGDIVIAEGILFVLKKECKFLSMAGVEISVPRKDEPFRVLAKSIRKLEEDAK